LFLIFIADYCHFHIRTIEGKTYDGVVKDKNEAQWEYEKAISQEESAGLIRYLVF